MLVLELDHICARLNKFCYVLELCIMMRIELNCRFVCAQKVHGFNPAAMI